MGATPVWVGRWLKPMCCTELIEFAELEAARSISCVVSIGFRIGVAVVLDGSPIWTTETL